MFDQCKRCEIRDKKKDAVMHVWLFVALVILGKYAVPI